jgi:LmbE family N-acetylglucosaminyl deacetylase
MNEWKAVAIARGWYGSIEGIIMIKLSLNPRNHKLRLLCLGAHSDDIEIGCGGTILEWLTNYDLDITWVVLCASGLRLDEARDSVMSLSRGADPFDVVVRDFRDGYLPAHFEELKNFFEELKSRTNPDIILTHCLEDRHQDHRLIAELTWQTFRDHFIVEYEIPKYEGDLAQPNLYVKLSEKAALKKIEHLKNHFATQQSKNWYRSRLFSGLMQLRGIECHSDSGYAEGFHARKCIL